LSMYLGLDLSMDIIPVRGILLRLVIPAKCLSYKLTHNFPAKRVYRIVKPYANRKSNQRMKIIFLESSCNLIQVSSNYCTVWQGNSVYLGTCVYGWTKYVLRC